MEAITGESIVLIVIDTISRALCGGDQNSPKEWAPLSRQHRGCNTKPTRMFCGSTTCPKTVRKD